MSHKKAKGVYDVGYGRPPKHTRFKPGRSGNPKGRPKGSKNISTILKDELNRMVTVRTADGPRRLLMKEVLIKRLLEMGTKGNLPAIKAALQLDATHAEPPPFELIAHDETELMKQLRAVGGEVGDQDDENEG